MTGLHTAKGKNLNSKNNGPQYTYISQIYEMSKTMSTPSLCHTILSGGRGDIYTT